MDVLDDVLGRVRLTWTELALSDNGRPWGIRFAAEGSMLHIVERGRCYLRQGDTCARLDAGTMVLHLSGASHALCDPADGHAKSVTFEGHRSFEPDGSIGRYGGDGPRTTILCMRFALARPLGDHLAECMPALMISAQDSAFLQAAAAALADEGRRGRPGCAAVTTRLAAALVVRLIRDWATDAEDVRGWLAGLRDPTIARALDALHNDPAERWTVDMIARRAGTSRTVLATRFHSVVGEPPLTYLTRWRLTSAAQMLREDHDRSTAEIAERVGYQSESSFAKAFKRRFGTGPGAYRRERPA